MVEIHKDVVGMVFHSVMTLVKDDQREISHGDAITVYGIHQDLWCQQKYVKPLENKVNQIMNSFMSLKT